MQIHRHLQGATSHSHWGVTKVFLGRHYTRLPATEMETTTAQRTDITKVQLGKPVSFIGVIYGNMGVRSLNRNRNHLIVISPNLSPAWMTGHKLGTWNTLHSLQTAQQAAERPFQGTCFVWGFSRQLSWLPLLRPDVVWPSFQLAGFTPPGRGLVKLVSFKDFLELLSVVLSPCSRIFVLYSELILIFKKMYLKLLKC